MFSRPQHHRTEPVLSDSVDTGHAGAETNTRASEQEPNPMPAVADKINESAAEPTSVVLEPRKSNPVMRFTYSTGDQPLTGYTIRRGLGVGGFGEVYFAVSEAGKEVA